MIAIPLFGVKTRCAGKSAAEHYTNIHGMTNYIIPQRILADAQNTHFSSGKVKKSHLFFSVNFYIPSRTLPFSIANIKCRCPNVLDHNNC